MKITAIKYFPTRIGQGNQLIIKVETDQDIYGWGASGLSGREWAVIGAIKHFRNFLIDKDPRQIGALWQEMYRSQYFEGGRVLTAAISAIDIALYDIKGKYFGVPVYELLGGKQREYIDCFASLRFNNWEELIHKTDILLEAGWKVIRLAPALYEETEPKGTFNPRENIAILADWLIRLREKIGTSVTLGIDYHHRLNVAETVSFLQKMPAGTLDFIEEPIRDENPAAYERLRSMVDVPFAIGEEFSSKWQFMPYLEREITQFARLDICNVGGFTEAMKVAAMAEAHYIDLMPHNPLGPICTAASLHLAAACSNFFCLEEINTEAENSGNSDPKFYPLQPQLSSCRYKLPQLPGLGIAFNEELAAKQEFQIIEPPRLKRADGSYTNW
ncbi:MAG: mandelate racemase/muconate lactonizing enzyme family protein [Bacteroidota bacterium]